jgi:hypothetical protein
MRGVDLSCPTAQVIVVVCIDLTDGSCFRNVAYFCPYGSLFTSFRRM